MLMSATTFVVVMPATAIMMVCMTVVIASGTTFIVLVFAVFVIFGAHMTMIMFVVFMAMMIMLMFCIF